MARRRSWAQPPVWPHVRGGQPEGWALARAPRAPACCLRLIGGNGLPPSTTLLGFGAAPKLCSRHRAHSAYQPASCPCPALFAVDACCSLCQGTPACTLFAWCQAGAARCANAALPLAATVAMQPGVAASFAADACLCCRSCMHFCNLSAAGSLIPALPPPGPTQLPEHPWRRRRRHARRHYGAAGPRWQRSCGAPLLRLPPLLSCQPCGGTRGQSTPRAALELWLHGCADTATTVAPCRSPRVLPTARAPVSFVARDGLRTASKSFSELRQYNWGCGANRSPCSQRGSDGVCSGCSRGARRLRWAWRLPALHPAPCRRAPLRRSAVRHAAPCRYCS